MNTLKGGCILLVVLYHVVLPGFEGTLKYLTAGSLPAHIWVAFNTVLSPLRMPAFFFVSGMLAARAINENPAESFYQPGNEPVLSLYSLGRHSVALYLWDLIGNYPSPYFQQH